MNHTPQIRKAIQFAARKHHGHFRADSEPLPYVTHLFSAAILVAEDGDVDEEVVIAALLHDTIEDTETSREEISREFGEKVAQIVSEVTEPKEEAGKKLEWKEGKKRYIAQLELGSDDALLVAMADKIDNIESKLEARERSDVGLFERFKIPQEQYIWYHGAVLHIAQERLPRHRLTKRFAEVHEREKSLLRPAT